MPRPRIAIASTLEYPLRRLWDLVAGAQEYANEAGWEYELCYVPEVRIEDRARIDGIVGRITPDAFAAAEQAGIPLVNAWISSPVASQTANVFVDCEAAGRMAVDHLLARGFRRILAVGPRGWPSFKNYLKGVRAACRENDVPFERLLLLNAPENSATKWRQITAKLEAHAAGWDQPIGLAVDLDFNARIVATILQNMGWQIPSQVAIVGNGNEALTCMATYPTISSIDMGYHRNGYEATALLDRLMQGEAAPKDAILTPPKELVVRASTDVYAVRDPAVQHALRFMADHSHLAISVDDITAATPVCRQVLERRFRTELGTTINKELIRLRIERLKRLLVETTMPVKELAGQSGFGATGNMYRAFKAHTGMALNAYREKHSDPRNASSTSLPSALAPIGPG